jgi:hypothetical protein
MLSTVFKELYDLGVLIFLDTDKYVINNAVIDVECFANRKKFLEMYTEPIEVGWVFVYTKSFDEVISTIKEDTCYLIEFGFNSDTEKKALEVGRLLTNSLIKNKFMAQWTEKAVKEHKVSTVITSEDLPENVQELIEEYEIETTI